jgi:hypothetical protein
VLLLPVVPLLLLLLLPVVPLLLLLPVVPLLPELLPGPPLLLVE